MIQLVTVRKEVRINKCSNSVGLLIQLCESTNTKTLSGGKEREITVNYVVILI